MLLADLIPATVLLVAIIDPFVSLSAMLSMHAQEAFDIPKTALSATIIAGALMLLFIFFGTSLLSFFHISLDAFRIGGGAIILLLGIQNVLGLEFGHAGKKTAIAVVIGTPLITGPGVATTLILQTQQFGAGIAILAASIALFITYIFLALGPRIERLLGEQLILVFSRIIGLFLTAYAAELIFSGIRNMFFGA